MHSKCRFLALLLCLSFYFSCLLFSVLCFASPYKKVLRTNSSRTNKYTLFSLLPIASISANRLNVSVWSGFCASLPRRAPMQVCTVFRRSVPPLSMLLTYSLGLVSPQNSQLVNGFSFVCLVFFLMVRFLRYRSTMCGHEMFIYLLFFQNPFDFCRIHIFRFSKKKVIEVSVEFEQSVFVVQ